MDAAASQAPAGSAAGGEVDYEKLEDPALHWVRLVDGYRTRDLDLVRRMLDVAKKSQWTGTLWKQEMAHMQLSEESPDEEF
jgi:hypothetical protein